MILADLGFNLQDLREVHDMLSERIKKWPDRWLKKGQQESKLEARREIARNLIKRTGKNNRSIAELVADEIATLRAESQH